MRPRNGLNLSSCLSASIVEDKHSTEHLMSCSFVVRKHTKTQNTQRTGHTRGKQGTCRTALRRHMPNMCGLQKSGEIASPNVDVISRKGYQR